MRKIKATKQNQKSTKLNHPKTTWFESYFCKLSLNAKFQLPRLCVSFIATQDSSLSKEKFWPKTFTLRIFLANFLLAIIFFGDIFLVIIFLAKFFLTNFFLQNYFFANILLANSFLATFFL